jgi:hypothetical protein
MGQQSIAHPERSTTSRTVRESAHQFALCCFSGGRNWTMLAGMRNMERLSRLPFPVAARDWQDQPGGNLRERSLRCRRRQ